MKSCMLVIVTVTLWSFVSLWVFQRIMNMSLLQNPSCIIHHLHHNLTWAELMRSENGKGFPRRASNPDTLGQGHPPDRKTNCWCNIDCIKKKNITAKHPTIIDLYKWQYNAYMINYDFIYFYMYRYSNNIWHWHGPTHWIIRASFLRSASSTWQLLRGWKKNREVRMDFVSLFEHT